MAYILGFIGADGYINKGESFVRIALKERDVDILEKIKNEVDFTGDIVKSMQKCGDKKFPIVTLCIYSKYAVKDLISLGIVNNKSFIVNMDNIPKEYMIDFIRGYFDGDGTVGEQFSKKSKATMLRARMCSGSEKLLIQTVNHLEELGVKKVKVRKDKEKELYNIEYSQKASKSIYELFYNDDSLIYLDRKKVKFDSILMKMEQQKHTY